MRILGFILQYSDNNLSELYTNLTWLSRNMGLLKVI